MRRGSAKAGLKYSLSNATRIVESKTLVYRQSQRKCVERAFRDAKQEIGLSDYQVRAWRGWRPFATLSMMVGTWLVREKWTFGAELPLLSIRDVRDMIAMSMVAGMSEKEMVEVLVERDRRRRRAIQSARSRPPTGKVTK